MSNAGSSHWRSKKSKVEDEEPPVNVKQALPIGELPEDFDGIPLDGSQYLAMANAANEALPFVTRVHNPYRQPSPSPVALPEISDPTTNTHPVFPTEAWRLVYVAHFMGYRKHLENLFPPSPPLPVPAHYPPIPQANKRSDWWMFINGHPRRRIKLAPVVIQSEIDEVEEEEMMNNPGGSYSPSRPYDELPNGNHHHQDAEEEEEGWNRAGPSGSRAEKDVRADLEEALNGNGDGDGWGEGTWEEGYGDDDEDYDEDFEWGGIAENGVIKKTELEPEEEKHRPREPLICFIQHLNSSEMIKILGHFTHWLNEYIDLQTPPDLLPTQPNHPPSPSPSSSTTTNQHKRQPNPLPENWTRWIFAILAVLSPHLSGEEISVLRELVRACSRVIVWRWEVEVRTGMYKLGGGWKLGERWKRGRDEAGVFGVGMGDGSTLGRKRKFSRDGNLEEEVDGDQAISKDGGKYRKVIDLVYQEVGVDETIARCWMVMEGVIHGWGQRDLTEDVERLFAGLEW